jgi:hypothetical protein
MPWISAASMQSLKLLADVLLARSNVRVMFNYVRSKRQLMLVMNLLRSSSRSIQHEAFHVFKVFVANPRKPDDIKSILISNREKLLRFLKQFLEEKGAFRCFHLLSLCVLRAGNTRSIVATYHISQNQYCELEPW